MDLILQLNKILQLYKIGAECTNCQEFARCRVYDLQLHSGYRIKQLEKYLNEIALALQLPSIPLLQVIPEQGIIRLEFRLPNKATLNLFDFALQTTCIEGNLPCLLGETYRGDPVWLELASAPHMLIGGTTGSGKSTLLHTIIANLIPQNVVLHLMDTKNIEFAPYHQGFRNIRVSLNYDQCLASLKNMLVEMEQRYQLNCSLDDLPYHIVIIDEFADIMMQDTNHIFQDTLCKLAQKSRAAKIHIILATQRPSVDVLNGTIKANFPARLACRVNSSINSKIILDQKGAEVLQGKGDAILKTNDCQRFQAAYTTSQEICDYYQMNQLNMKIM